MPCTAGNPCPIGYFLETDKYSFKLGETLEGFLPEWVGEFLVFHVFLGDEPLMEGQEIPSGSYEAAVSASPSWLK